MARYDASWARGPDDPPFRNRGGPGWGGPRGYDREYRYDAGADRGGIYGPARYGLGPYYERLRQRQRSDDELREEIEEALFYDTWVDADAITVVVKDGIVTLRGELPDYEEIRYAVDDTWDVDGVRGVRSELTVRERTAEHT